MHFLWIEEKTALISLHFIYWLRDAEGECLLRDTSKILKYNSG
jgi:hypothetical protein